MIFVDDCFKDIICQELIDVKVELLVLCVFVYWYNVGQFCFVCIGVMFVCGMVVVMLDGDGQNLLENFLIVIDVLMCEDVLEDLVLVGGDCSVNCQDLVWKKFVLCFGNGICKCMLNDDCNDIGCGFKVFKCDVYLLLFFFDYQY